MVCPQRPGIDVMITEGPAEAYPKLFALDGMLLMVSNSRYTVMKAFVEGRKEIGGLLEEASVLHRNGASETSERVKERKR